MQDFTSGYTRPSRVPEAAVRLDVRAARSGLWQRKLGHHDAHCSGLCCSVGGAGESAPLGLGASGISLNPAFSGGEGTSSATLFVGPSAGVDDGDGRGFSFSGDLTSRDASIFLILWFAVVPARIPEAGEASALRATDFSRTIVSSILLGTPTFLRADSLSWRYLASANNLPSKA